MLSLELRNIPSYTSYKMLTDIIKDHLKLEKNDFKIFHRVKSGKAIIKLKNSISEQSNDDEQEKFHFLTKFMSENPLTIKKHVIRIKVLRETIEENMHQSKKQNNLQDEKEVNIDIRNIVTPLWKKTYSEQLIFKHKLFNNFLATNKLIMSSTIIPFDDQNKKLIKRNSFEFTFGFDKMGLPTCGFRGKSFISDKNLVCDPQHVDFLSPEIREKIIFINQQLKKAENEFLVYNRKKCVGFLRMIKIRMNTENEFIAILDLNYKNQNREILESKKSEIDTFKPIVVDACNFIQFFGGERIAKSIYNFCISLPFQNILFTLNNTLFEGIQPKNNIYILRGEASIHTIVDNYKFILSPFGFFQCNIYILSQIINTIKENFDRKNKYLLDLCCGQMCIGILLSDVFNEIIGIENNQQSIQDYIDVKEMNQIKNTKIIANDVNLINVDNILRENIHMDIETNNQKTYTAILDPPRAGIQKKLVKRIRKSNLIAELFYISCDYTQSITNILDLCKPESNAYGRPFRLINIWAFDMFVGDKKLEVIYHFRRD